MVAELYFHVYTAVGQCYVSVKGKMRRKKRRRNRMERVAGEVEKRKISEAIRWTAC